MKNDLPKIDIDTKRAFLKNLFGEIMLGMAESEIDERMEKLNDKELDLLILMAQEQADFMRGIDYLMQERAPEDLKKIEDRLDKEEEQDNKRKAEKYKKRFDEADSTFNKLENQLDEITKEEIEEIAKNQIHKSFEAEDKVNEK